MAETELYSFDERDFDEVDHEHDEDLQEEAGSPTTAKLDGRPSVIVDNVHVKYRVFGGRKAAAAKEMGRVKALFNRSRSHVGAINEVHAVRGVSFVAHHGESIGILGMNGAGKSTLLRAVAGLMPVSSGDVYVSGDRKSTRLNSSHVATSYAAFCLEKKQP